MSEKARSRLAAICGLYCGACSLYRAWHDADTEAIERMAKDRGVTPEDLRCDGCRSDVLSYWCRDCGFKRCLARRTDGVRLCYECADYPCRMITGFRYDGRKHHLDVLENVRRQKEIGLEAWLDEQEADWRCPECGAPIHWYQRKCRCGAKLRQRWE
jgi:predicted RNA-binding Zn-ribbon protein involved in translation (DUF1610 family)